jgi:hypothetical protein
MEAHALVAMLVGVLSLYAVAGFIAVARDSQQSLLQLGWAAQNANATSCKCAPGRLLQGTT